MQTEQETHGRGADFQMLQYQISVQPMTILIAIRLIVLAIECVDKPVLDNVDAEQLQHWHGKLEHRLLP